MKKLILAAALLGFAASTAPASAMNSGCRGVFHNGVCYRSVEMAVRFGYRPAPGHVAPVHRDGKLNNEDVANLGRISQKVLGPVPPDARGYTAHVTSRIARPAPGCRKVTERRAGGGTLDRWRCPPGTIHRLGW